MHMIKKLIKNEKSNYDSITLNAEWVFCPYRESRLSEIVEIS